VCQHLRYIFEVGQIPSHFFRADCPIRKKILVKVFAGPIWEGKLMEFVATFTERRNQFEFALSIHTAVGIDEANIQLATVDERTAELNQK
jgi:hypothetical protein